MGGRRLAAHAGKPHTTPRQAASTRSGQWHAQGMHRDGRSSARRRWAAWGKLGAIGDGLEVGHRSHRSLAVAVGRQAGSWLCGTQASHTRHHGEQKARPAGSGACAGCRAIAGHPRGAAGPRGGSSGPWGGWVGWGSGSMRQAAIEWQGGERGQSVGARRCAERVYENGHANAACGSVCVWGVRMGHAYEACAWAC